MSTRRPIIHFSFPFFSVRPEKKKFSSTKRNAGFFFFFRIFLLSPNNNQKNQRAGDVAAFEMFLGKCFYSVQFLWPSCCRFVTFWRLTGVTSRKHFSVEPRTFSAAPTDEMSSCFSLLFFSSPKFSFIWECLAYRNSRTKSTCNQDALTVAIKGT